jgi:O-antigen/teichoic acid export membrane protein
LTSLPFLDKAPVDLFRISLLCIPATIFHLYITRIYLGMGKVPTFTILTAGPRILALVALLIGSLTHLDVRLAILIHAGSEGVIAVAGAVGLVVYHGARPVTPQLAGLLRSLHYGVRFYFGKLASMANVQMGTIILSLSPVGVGEIGLFAAATAIASRLWIVADALQTAMLPRASADPEGNKEAIAQIVRLCLLCTVAVSVLFLICAKPIIAIVLSPRFLPVVLPFQILLPGICIRVIPRILSAYFNGVGRPGITSAAIAVAVLVNILLMYVLLPVWGLLGVAVAMVVAYVTEAVIMALAFRRLSGVSLTQLLKTRRTDFSTLGRVLRQLLPGARRSPTMAR